MNLSPQQRINNALQKAFVAAHTRRLKNGKTVQVAEHWDKRLRKDAQGIHAHYQGDKAEHKDDWERLHREQHVLHHTDKARYEANLRKVNDTLTHHHKQAAYHEAQRDIARANGDSAALSTHNKVITHHHNKVIKADSQRRSH